ncbi:MAG: polysaccharide deacetylase family protein [Peptostreptococcales bacterium]
MIVTIRKTTLSCILIGIIVLAFMTTTIFNNSIMASAAKKELPIYSVETEEKKIAISFDAAWGDDKTLQILDILDEYNVKTTFFLVGFWVDKYPEHVKEIHKRGHEVQNHSTTHPQMSRLSAQQMSQEINITGDKIQALTGEKPYLIRPPFGDYNDLLIKTCRDNDYYAIQWDVDSLDWKEIGTMKIVDRVVRNVKNGSIVLFHNNSEYALEYLPLILTKLKSEGYEVVPVGQLILKDNYYMDHTGKQCKMKG